MNVRPRWILLSIVIALATSSFSAYATQCMACHNAGESGKGADVALHQLVNRLLA